MKKYILIFLLFCFIAIVYLQWPLYTPSQLASPDKHFVSISNNKFSLNGKEFYPLVVNYIVSAQNDEHELWPCVYTGYNIDFNNPCRTKDSCLMQLKADMDLIKEMGFNAVRFVGIGEEDINHKTGELSIKADGKSGNLILSSNKSYERYFNALAELFDVANRAGLKIILLTHVAPEIKTTEDHIKRLATRFKNDTALMAYDLFNEPLYFDSLERKKRDVYKITKSWNKMLKLNAPNQLFTIGLEGVREVFKWDPNILDVDFISFHPYEFEPDQVRNEFYWYGTYVKKPWIIGETGLPADNDSVSYEAQKIFAHNTLKQAYNCGAIGYSWWQYKDVDWKKFHPSFLGVVNRKGETKTKKENLIIHGTVKPIAEEFEKFDPTAQKDSCLCLKNYYNYWQYKTFRIKGYLTDENGVPIQGGVVLGWNQFWVISYYTFTKADGSFELYGDFSFYHWMASASLYTMVRGDIQPDNAKILPDGIPTVDIGKLKVNRVKL